MVIERYFASANGYFGFRSYFNEVFNEEKLSRLFILKGGPGTGKSTFMKRIAAEFSGRADSCEVILCSSDKESLDGVILSTANGRVAIIDGTAPHTIDPKFPGAVSEIVNLGEGWDGNRLIVQREKVIELTQAKSEEYSSAYELLSVAGRVMDRMQSVSVRHFDKKRAAAAAKILLSDNEKIKEEPKVRLLSSFGKSGRYFLPVSERFEKINISGKHCSATFFMSVIKNLGSQSGIIQATLPSALDGNCFDGILTNNKAYLIADDGISADNFMSHFSVEEEAELSSLERIHGELLKLATEHFSRASNMHFSLENIYSSLMDHSKNDKKLHEVKSLCAEALGI